MIVNGIQFNDQEAEFFPDGSLRDATLSIDTMIQGFSCTGGRSVVFYQSGRIKLFWLSSQTPVGNVLCSPGVTYLHENGQLWNGQLGEDVTIDNRLHLEGERCTFDKEGKLLEFSESLDNDQNIDDIPCSGARRVWKYANGHLSKAVLSSSCSIGGQEYPRGTEISLNEKGNVEEWYPFDLDSGQRYKESISGVFEVDWI